MCRALGLQGFAGFAGSCLIYSYKLQQALLDLEFEIKPQMEGHFFI